MIATGSLGRHILLGVVGVLDLRGYRDERHRGEGHRGEGSLAQQSRAY